MLIHPELWRHVLLDAVWDSNRLKYNRSPVRIDDNFSFWITIEDVALVIRIVILFTRTGIRPLITVVFRENILFVHFPGKRILLYIIDREVFFVLILLKNNEVLPHFVWECIGASLFILHLQKFVKCLLILVVRWDHVILVNRFVVVECATFLELLWSCVIHRHV